jgi:hypothetical protein
MFLSSFAVMLPIDSPIRCLSSRMYQKDSNNESMLLIRHKKVRYISYQRLVHWHNTCLNSAKFVSADAVLPLLAESIAVKFPEN